MRKVGDTNDLSHEKTLTYPMVTYDADGWADASLFHPIDYDLLYLKLKGKKGVIRGWCSGNHWDGLKMQDGDKVVYWKKVKHDEEKH